MSVQLSATNLINQGGFMKKIVFFIIVSLFAFSAQAADLKIGYVDLNKALTQSEEGKKAIKILQDMAKAKEELINKKGNEIKKLDDEIAKQASILNPEAIKEKKEEREKLIRDYQRIVKDSQDEVRKKENDLMKKIIKNIRKVLAEIGEEEGYSVIFERTERVILYIPKEVDLTDRLIKRFNESSKKAEKK